MGIYAGGGEEEEGRKEWDFHLKSNNPSLTRWGTMSIISIDFERIQHKEKTIAKDKQSMISKMKVPLGLDAVITKLQNKEIDKFQAGNSLDEKSSGAHKDDTDSDNLVILDEGMDLMNGEDDDSSDYESSSDEDDVVEFMPDGEVMRKKSRGFKQLNNCKRFWKASLYQ